MACKELPLAELPSLPTGLTLGADLASITFDPTLCCKLLPFPVISPPASFLVGIATDPAVVAILKAKLALVTAYFDSKPTRCPRE